jgi:MFS family permease
MPQKWKIVAMLSVIGALNYGDRTAIASVFPLLRADLGLSDLMLAGIGSVFLWSYAVGSPVAGYLADRLSRTRMLLFSLVAWSVIMALTGFVHSGAVLLGTRVLLGIAECIYLPASVALIADHHGTETRATAMGLQVAGINLGLIGGSAIAGYLGERFGWRVDFFILGGAGLLLALIAFFVLCDAPHVQPSDNSLPVDTVADDTLPNWRDVGHLLRMPGYLAVVSGAMLIAIGSWAFLNWLPLFLYNQFHLSLAVAGLTGSSVLQVAAIVGAVLGGYLSDRFAGRSPLRRMLFLAISCFCAAPFLLTFFWDESLGPINVSIFIYSLIQALGEANECPIICELAGSRLRSTALGIFNMANCLAGGVGILWAGFILHDYGLGTAFGSIAVTVAFAGIVVLIGYFLVHREHRIKSLADPVAVLEDEGRT